VIALLNGLWALLRRLPWQVWAAAALVAAFWWWGGHRYNAGVAAERARWEAAQAEADRKAREAEAKRDAAAAAVNDKAAARASEAATEVRTETAAAVERVRYVTRTIDVPADCPAGLPDLVRDEGRAAVARARAAGDQVRAGRDP